MSEMSFDAAACALWLGASVTVAGAATGLPKRLVKLLLEAFDATLFDENDVQDPDAVLGAEDIKVRLAVWDAVIEDACKLSTPAVPVLASEKLRFHAWFRALYHTVARDSYYIAIKYRDGLSELSEARNSYFVAIWTDSPPLFFIATQIGAGS